MGRVVSDNEWLVIVSRSTCKQVRPQRSRDRESGSSQAIIKQGLMIDSADAHRWWWCMDASIIPVYGNQLIFMIMVWEVRLGGATKGKVGEVGMLETEQLNAKGAISRLK